MFTVDRVRKRVIKRTQHSDTGDIERTTGYTHIYNPRVSRFDSEQWLNFMSLKRLIA